ncbi:MAG: hypothetical protein IJL17_09415 [Kiritimatiellae bacterium]|nr:hypothetical protein [Kiritimatiellia bacterium]
MLFDRTFHPDEANQAFTTGRLLETGQYAYQPQDHHGPTLYYAAAALQKAAGHGDTASLDGTLLRCTPLVFAVLALVFGFLAVRRIMKPATGLVDRFAPSLFALLLGTSPVFAFFATDFIQETLLACFLTMMFWAGVGYLRPGAKWKTGTWALFFGTAAGLAFATKETCLISFAAAALAAAPFLVRHLTREKVSARARDGVLAVLGFLIVACILYSDFGRDFHGVYNAFIAAPLSYIGRAAGDAAASTGANWHVHPWWQYFRWLFADEYGALAFFVLCGTCFGLFARFVWTAIRPELRERASGPLSRSFLFALGYALLLLAFYSAIPYKTPWCALQMHIGLLLAAVLGFAVACGMFTAVLSLPPPSNLPAGCRDYVVWLQGHPRLIKALGALPLTIAAAVLLLTNGYQIARMSRDPDSKDIPYNYASASPEVRQLAATVAAAVGSATNHEPQTTPFIAVALPAADTWPFPWYNRPYEPQTGYWTSFDDLKQIAAAGVKPTVVIVPMEEGHLVQPIFPHLKHTKRFYMRPGARSREGKMRGGVRVRVFW